MQVLQSIQWLPFEKKEFVEMQNFKNFRAQLAKLEQRKSKQKEDTKPLYHLPKYRKFLFNIIN